MAVERQSGSDDCGLFVLAFAVSLLTGFDPVNVVYEQPRMYRPI